MDKLVIVFPPHVQPIIGGLLTAIRKGDAAGRTFTEVADAIVCEARISVDAHLTGGRKTLDIQPDLLIPYRGRWYVVGEQSLTDGQSRTRMIRLDRIASVAVVAGARAAS